MAESFREKRRRELAGQTSAASSPEKPAASGGQSFRQRRIAELNGTSPDQMRQKDSAFQRLHAKGAEDYEAAKTQELIDLARNERRADENLSPAASAKLRSDIVADNRAEQQESAEYKAAYDKLPPVRKMAADFQSSRVGKLVMGAERAHSDFLRQGLDTASLGATRVADEALLKSNLTSAREKENLKERIDSARTSTAGKVGQFSGYLVPGATSERIAAGVVRATLKNAPKAARTVAQGLGAGAIFGVANETGEAVTGKNDQSLRERALDVAIETGVGGAVGGLAAGGKAAITAYRQRGLRKAVDDFVNRMEAPQEARGHPSGRINQSGTITSRPGAAAVTDPANAPTATVSDSQTVVRNAQEIQDEITRLQDELTVVIGERSDATGFSAVRQVLRESNLQKQIQELEDQLAKQTTRVDESRVPTTSAGFDPGAEMASNFRRWENIQKQYDDAVEQQYQFLKQSMKERGGVTQGTLIKDPTTGNVVDRVGRVSSNPRWYRDFFAQHGRKPSDKELRVLAREHVNKGYVDDDAGTIPAWKPADIQDIDGELADIRNMMNQVADPAERQALEKVASTLESSRAQIKQQLPEGVQARAAGRVQAMANSSPTPAGGAAPASAAAQQANPVPPPAPATPPANPKKTITRTQLVNNIKKHLGVVIDTGRTGHGKNVLGIYKVDPEVIRSAAHQDYDTIAHEIGHHLVKKHRLLDPQYERELTDMMDQMGVHNYKAYPKHQWFDEGVAEYFRLGLSDPLRAQQLAPRFSEFLQRVLPKDVQKGLRNVQKDIRTWLDQGDYERAKGKLDLKGKTENQNASKSKMYTRFFDDLHPIELVEKALKGTVQLGSRSMYKLARLSRGVGEQAKMAATRGIFDRQGNKLSEGLRIIIEPLEKIGMKEDDLGLYLAVKHAQDLKRRHGKDIPFTDDEMDAVLARWDADPVAQKAQKEIVRYNNALTDILVDAQILSATTVSKMRKMYPNYVPFLRYFDDDAVAGFKNGGYGSSRGFANVLNPTKRMTEDGSTRTVINPLESMVKNTFLVMNAAAKNRVGLQLADLSKIDGAGAWVESVPGGASAKEHIVNVWKKGNQTAYKIRDPELYNALLSLDHESANSLVKFLGGAAGILRAGATLTPEFMARNVFRDVAGAIVNSTKYGFNPLDFFKGFFHVVTKSGTFEKFVNSGGAMSTMMSLDRDTNREALQAIYKLSLKDKALNVVTSPAELAKYLSGYKLVKGTVGVLRKGAEISELSTKVGAFNKTLKKTGDLEEAAYTARDLMDFNRAGSAIRQANRAVAFLNASLQGTDKMVRAFKDNPPSFLTRAFTTLVMPASALYYWNRNLPDDMQKKYDNIPQWQKDTFFIIGIPGVGEFVRIPKPFEAGMLFATSTDRMMEWIKDNDKEAFDGYGRAVLSSLTPPMLFTALSPMLEAITNHSFFRNAPIVPQGEQKREKRDQHGVYTSETAKEIGAFMDRIGIGESNAASPRIIDNTIKGYTAGLGAYAVDLIDEGIKAADGKERPAQPARKWTEDPFFRSFFVSTAGGGQIRDDFYKKWERLENKRNSAILRAEENAPADADVDSKAVTFAGKEDYERMKPYQKEITKLIKEYKEIQKGKELSGKQKRSMLDDLDGKMNEAARKAIGK